jgi:hypothetical protein
MLLNSHPLYFRPQSPPPNCCLEYMISCNIIHVTWRLKAGIAEPGRKFIVSQLIAKHTFPHQRISPLLANVSVSTFPWTQTFFMATGNLYKDPCREEQSSSSSVVWEKSFEISVQFTRVQPFSRKRIQRKSVELWRVNQRTREAEEGMERVSSSWRLWTVINWL